LNLRPLGPGEVASRASTRLATGPTIPVYKFAQRTMTARTEERAAAPTGAEWLSSPYLERLAGRVGHQYGLGTEDVQDVIQEVRIALWRVSAATRLGPGWIRRVAARKAADCVRRRIRAREQARVASAEKPPVRDGELDRLLHSRATSLPPRLRQFYDLHYRLGLTEREMARRLGICRASVRWLDRACRNFLIGVPRPTGP
jgi:RNA polymerase sigma factor (sigma-70 family)